MLIKHKLNPIGSRFGVNTFIAAVLGAGLLFAAVPANAYISHQDIVRLEFNADFLESPAGIERVYSIMTDKAEQSCRSNGFRSLEDKRLEAKCTLNLLEEFIEGVNDERLTSYHEEQLSS